MRFDSFMVGHGYSRNSYDNSVYYKKISDSLFVDLFLKAY